MAELLPLKVYPFLSYDVTVIQWITSYHKNHTCNNTLARTRNVMDNVRVNNFFFIEMMFILNAIKPHFKSHMINRILHSWSFHMILMKLAEGSCHKFNMK